MKRRIYAAVNADIDRDGLKSAIKALFDNITRKNNISGYTIKSLHLDKTGVKNPTCTCTIKYELEGCLYRWRKYHGPSIQLNVPVGVEIPEDYYLDDPKIEYTIMGDKSKESELRDRQAQFETIFEYFTKVAEDLARQYKFTIECHRYPDTVEPGTSTLYFMSAQILSADTKYTTQFDNRFYDQLDVVSDNYYASAYGANISFNASSLEKFSKQRIDERLEQGFAEFEAELRKAEMRLDSAQDEEVRANNCLQFIANLCRSSGCTFEYSDKHKRGAHPMSIGSIGAINCVIVYNEKSSSFDLRDYLNKPTANVKKSIQSRIRRLKDTDTKPRAKKYEQEDLSWL